MDPRLDELRLDELSKLIYRMDAKLELIEKNQNSMNAKIDTLLNEDHRTDLRLVKLEDAHNRSANWIINGVKTGLQIVVMIAGSFIIAKMGIVPITP